MCVYQLLCQLLSFMWFRLRTVATENNENIDHALPLSLPCLSLPLWRDIPLRECETGEGESELSPAHRRCDNTVIVSWDDAFGSAF